MAGAHRILDRMQRIHVLFEKIALKVHVDLAPALMRRTYTTCSIICNKSYVRDLISLVRESSPRAQIVTMVARHAAGPRDRVRHVPGQGWGI